MNEKEQNPKISKKTLDKGKQLNKTKKLKKEIKKESNKKLEFPVDPKDLGRWY